MKHINFTRVCFFTTLVTSIILLVTGFILPPMGVIDNSVLKGTSILLAFASVAQIPEIAKSGVKTIRKGDTLLEMK